MSAKHSIAFLFLASVPLADGCGEAALLCVVPVQLAAFAALDAWLGAPAAEPRGTGSARSAGGIACRCLLWLYIPLQMATIAHGIAVAAGGAGLLRLAGLALAIGVTGGIFGILAAHEMIHSKRPAERALGTTMLAALTCLHFRIAHLHLHHRLAASPADPSTARLGESVYRFIARSLAGQWRGAWRLERRRAARGRFPGLVNRATGYAAVSASIYLGLILWLGPRAALFQLVQSAIAIAILEVFNYVAHYGLARAALPGGGIENFTPYHAWNTSHRFNNWALFNGGHHSDHHLAPARAYQTLRALPAVPMLPFGYAATMMLALVPPLWRRVMDGRAAAARSRRGEAAARLAQQPERDGDIEHVPRDAVAEGGLV
jgi:alkane 1-monooxygenase